MRELGLSGVRRGVPRRNIDDVEFATLEWVDWFNNRRLLEPIGDIPPAEFEGLYWLERSWSPGLPSAASRRSHLWAVCRETPAARAVSVTVHPYSSTRSQSNPLPETVREALGCDTRILLVQLLAFQHLQPNRKTLVCVNNLCGQYS